jgi:hypothetical protein
LLSLDHVRLSFQYCFLYAFYWFCFPWNHVHNYCDEL